MLEEHNKRDEIHLINLISRRSNNTPNFALLIGAGASASSGVRTASQMIAEWRRQLYAQSKSNEPYQEWLQKQDWYEDDEEYSILFENVCDQRSHRRIYIEECVKDAKPSWGYIYLANIIANNYFNVIFTPNFDDLLNEACFLYADLRPIVCAHDSAVVDIRVTSARPKIIKLHGDFLYDSIKNTVRETEILEKNMRDKFMQFAREYGLVLAGYGGNDRSIMDTLEMVLRSEGHFPNGLYWCRRKEDEVSKKLERLMRRENAYWVEIEGFDEFMAELHKGLGLTLPDAVRDPYKATTERLNRFIVRREEIRHEVIKADVVKLREHVERYEQALSGEVPIADTTRFSPHLFLASTEYNSANYERALHYLEKALIQEPNEVTAMSLRILAHFNLGNLDKALELSEEMIKQAPGDFRSYLNRGLVLSYLGKLEDAIVSYNTALAYTGERTEEWANVLAARANVALMADNWEEALSDARRALQITPDDKTAIINMCIALKRLGRQEEAKVIIQDTLPQIKIEYLRACAFAVLDDKENMLKELETAIEKDKRYRVQAKSDPDFTDYREDPDFRKLVYEGQD